MLPIAFELGAVALHTIIIYLFLVLALSLIGHRQISELSLTELVIVMALGSSVETAMVAGDTSLPAGLTSAATLMVSNRVFSLMIRRWDWFRKLIVGRPIILVYKGRLMEKNLQKAELTEEDVLEGIRERGYDNLGSIRLAVLEIDGTISVVPSDSPEGGQKEEKNRE